MKSLPVTISIMLALGLLTHPLFAQWGAGNVTFTISGNTGVGEVELEGFPSGVIRSDSRGFYTTEVRYTWTGEIVASKEGYEFDPPSLNYNPVKSDLTGQDFTPSIKRYTVSGRITIPHGVQQVLLEGLPHGPIQVGPDGRYEATVAYGWSGTVTPVKEGVVFTPAFRQYSKVIRAMSNQDFLAKRQSFNISGRIQVEKGPLAGVRLHGFPSHVVTERDGSYSGEVQYGWSGAIVPVKDGYVFEPGQRECAEMLMSLPNQDYYASRLTYVLTGSLGVDNARLNGFDDGEVIYGPGGYFEARVNWGSNVVLTPKLDGYEFNPPNRRVSQVKENMEALDFEARAKTCKIIGETVVMGKPVSGIQMFATNGGRSDTTDARGRFCVEVPYNWTGEIIPIKEGWNFDPPSKSYFDVKHDIDETRPSQDRSIPSEPVDIEPTKPNVLMIPTAQKSKQQLDAMCEDIQVMSHLLYQAVQGKHRRIGGVFREYGSLLNRDCLAYDAMYIEGTGVIFFLLVDYQFEKGSGVFEPTVTRSDTDAVWDQARQQLSQPIVQSDSDTWKSADEVIDEVLKVLKHTVNIRGLSESEEILVVLNPDQGTGSSSLVIKANRNVIEGFHDDELDWVGFRDKVKVLSY